MKGGCIRFNFKLPSAQLLTLFSKKGPSDTRQICFLQTIRVSGSFCPSLSRQFSNSHLSQLCFLAYLPFPFPPSPSPSHPPASQAPAPLHRNAQVVWPSASAGPRPRSHGPRPPPGLRSVRTAAPPCRGRRALYPLPPVPGPRAATPGSLGVVVLRRRPRGAPGTAGPEAPKPRNVLHTWSLLFPGVT